jgi:hypothetical protein
MHNYSFLQHVAWNRARWVYTLMISKRTAARRVINKTPHAEWALKEVARVMDLEPGSKKAQAYALHVLWCQCNTGWWMYASTTVSSTHGERSPTYAERILLRGLLDKIKHDTIVKNIRVLEEVYKNNN